MALVELAEHRQLPRGVLEAVGIVVFPLEPVVRGFFGGDQRAARRLASDRPLPISTPKLIDRSIDIAADPDGRAEQRVERLDMVAERQLGLVEPGENPAVALVEGAVAATRPSSRPTICSTSLPFAVGRQGREDFRIIEDRGRRSAPGRRPLRLARSALRLAGWRSLTRPRTRKRRQARIRRDAGEDEQAGGDVDEDQTGFEQRRPEQQGHGRGDQEDRSGGRHSCGRPPAPPAPSAIR